MTVEPSHSTPCISRAEVKYLTNLGPAPGEVGNLDVSFVEMSLEGSVVRRALTSGYIPILNVKLLPAS